MTPDKRQSLKPGVLLPSRRLVPVLLGVYDAHCAPPVKELLIAVMVLGCVKIYCGDYLPLQVACSRHRQQRSRPHPPGACRRRSPQTIGSMLPCSSELFHRNAHRGLLTECVQMRKMRQQDAAVDSGYRVLRRSSASTQPLTTTGGTGCRRR